MAARRKTFRLDDALIARIEAIAKVNGTDSSTVARFALQRGVAAMEQELGSTASQTRRRVLSRGVD